MSSKLETVGRSPKRNERDPSITYMGYLEPVLFKVILGSLGAFVSKQPVTQEQLTLERHEITFRIPGY